MAEPPTPTTDEPQPAAPPQPCDAAWAFAKGELTPEQAAAFRDHLQGCEACRQAVPKMVYLDALL